MQPHNEFRIHPQVVQIGCYWGEGGHTELYLLEGDSLAIIDAGVSETPAKYIAPALEAHGRKLSDIDILINTHGHHDHAGGDGALVAASGAKVWVHEADVRIAEDPGYQFDTYFANRYTLVGWADRLDAARVAFAKNATPPAKVDRQLRDGEVLDLGKGLRLRVVNTPGHTRGSICLCWESEGLVFSGDAVMGQGSRLGGFPLVYFPDEYRKTIAALLAMDIRTLGLGHHYRTQAVPRDSVHYGPNIQKFLQASREILEFIGDALDRAASARPGTTFHEVAQAATDLAGERLPIQKGEDGLPAAGSVEAFYAFWQQR
jgi:glyoxylase-like metal-dependent hydrolase (beta-lactamase superfamily II)